MLGGSCRGFGRKFPKAGLNHWTVRWPPFQPDDKLAGLVVFLAFKQWDKTRPGCAVGEESELLGAARLRASVSPRGILPACADGVMKISERLSSTQ